MTYTINQAVDVNAQVDIGNININTSTISSTNTNGDILLSPNGTGNVAIGTATPDEKLHVAGNLSLDAFGADGNGIYFRDGYNSSSDKYNLSLAVKDWRGGTTVTDGLLMSGYHGIGFMTQSNTYNASNVRMFIELEGDVGIGTITPKSKLHINGSYGGTDTLTSAINKYFSANNTNTSWSYTTGSQTLQSSSLYATDNIITSKYYVAHGSSTFSDRRIKDNIVDVEDDICLQKLRLIKPKQYTYKDTVAKGTAPVWGFIAQEVAETLDYTVDKIEKAIPNVYKIASVSNDGLVLTFDEPVNLEPTNKLQLKTFVSEEHDVTISQVLSPTTISLTEPLTEEHHTGTLGDESIVRKVFVYGQYVDDFHVLKKDAIFTVAVAALQEVDRRQTTDNERILELEGDLTEAQETIAILQAQVAALLHHTGVTI